MRHYKSPLSLFFVWHPSDSVTVKPLYDHCCRMLQRDVDKPFSRAMNLPTFFRTTYTKSIPSDIDAASKNVLIFAFVGAEVAADKEWTAYMKMLANKRGVRFIPIALDKYAYTLNSVFDGINCIRATDFQGEHKESLFFINVAHEIYRYALNDSFSKLSLGKASAIELFLSHSKGDDWALELAKELKRTVDNSTMRSFFDAQDIAPGYKFDSEIKGHIKESTVIEIHSDSYSARYWCQREIMTAKEWRRPIIAVDCLNDYEDRRFTYSANIPVIHIGAQTPTTKGILFRILSSALLETVRINYSMLLLTEYKACGWLDNKSKLMPRPPEATDVLALIQEDKGRLKVRCNCLVYPEPSVYIEEHAFLRKFNIKASTPLTSDIEKMNDLSVGISISTPTDEELIETGQDSRHLAQLSQDIARHILARNSRLIYGGDLRVGGFTHFIFEEAKILQDRFKTKTVKIDNYIAWPIYTKDTSEVKLWKAKYRGVASMIEITPPVDVLRLIPDRNSFLPPTNPQNQFVWSRCLTKMRRIMINKCTVRICAGGKHSGYSGIMPGVLEEIIIAIEMKKPLYLLGGYGGITSTICHMLKSGGIPERMTREWQIQHNAGYSDLLNYASGKKNHYSADYGNIVKTILGFGLAKLSAANGLSQTDNLKLFDTPFVDEALHLVLKGMKTINT